MHVQHELVTVPRAERPVPLEFQGTVGSPFLRPFEFPIRHLSGNLVNSGDGTAPSSLCTLCGCELSGRDGDFFRCLDVASTLVRRRRLARARLL